MTKNLNYLGLKSIAENYDLFFVDLWGVVHNGISPFKDALTVLNELEKINKEIIEEIKSAANFALDSKFPSSEELYTDVYI